MRQIISRFLVLVVMFGFLVFASTPNSNAVVPQFPGICCQNCEAAFWPCLQAGRGEDACCAAYRDCHLNCYPAAWCLPPDGYCR